MKLEKKTQTPKTSKKTPQQKTEENFLLNNRKSLLWSVCSILFNDTHGFLAVWQPTCLDDF